MTWLRSFLLGVFTRHLGVKALALLLSVGLFGFVQAQLTGTQEIPRLVLRFSLAEELRARYILITDAWAVSGLTMTGMRSKVDPQAKLFQRSQDVHLTIDQRFLSLYGEKHGEGIRIAIDPALFRDDRLFGKDIAVGQLPSGHFIEIEELVSKPARVEVSKTTPTTLRNHPYEGTEKDGRLRISFNVSESATLVGPASAFLGTPTVYVSVPNLADQLSRYPIAGDRGVATLGKVAVEWGEGNMNPDRVPLLRVQSQELGNLSASEFERRIEARIPVIIRKQKHPVSLPILIRQPLRPEYDLLRDWTPVKVFIDADIETGQKQLLEVRMPPKLGTDPAFVGNLVLVLDVAAADLRDDGSLIVPFYLDLEDRSRENDFESLAQVEIVGESSAEFRRKR